MTTALLALGIAVASAAPIAAVEAPGFTATVSGAITATLRGDAVAQDVAVTSDDSATSSWITLTVDRAANHRIQLSRAHAGPPVVGTHRIVDSRDESEPAEGAWTATYERSASGGDDNFTARSGTLEIRSVTSSTVTGRFTFDATDDARGERRITVAGRFSAARERTRVK